MTKFLLFFLCALLLLTEPGAAAPADATAATVETETLAALTDIPRPRYKPYRGNSRRKYRRNIFRRIGAKRRARHKAKTPPRRGVITVDPPVRNQ